MCLFHVAIAEFMFFCRPKDFVWRNDRYTRVSFIFRWNLNITSILKLPGPIVLTMSVYIKYQKVFINWFRYAKDIYCSHQTCPNPPNMSSSMSLNCKTFVIVKGLQSSFCNKHPNVSIHQNPFCYLVKTIIRVNNNYKLSTYMYSHLTFSLRKKIKKILQVFFKQIV